MKKIAIFLEPWLQLVIITSACWTGGIFAIAVYQVDPSKPDAVIIKILLVGTVVGFLVALGQGFLLRGETAKSSLWIVVFILGTAIGLGIELFVIQRVVSGLSVEISALLGGAAGGLIAGLIQSTGLRDVYGDKLPYVICSVVVWSLAQGLSLSLIGDSAAAIVRAGTIAILNMSTLGWVTTCLLAVWALLATTPPIRHKTSGGPTRWWY
ncbi:MAG: hypothetical protein PVG14_06470 [Anaerolineales bacterium]|jgi:hypothetical protein